MEDNEFKIVLGIILVIVFIVGCSMIYERKEQERIYFMSEFIQDEGNSQEFYFNESDLNWSGEFIWNNNSNNNSILIWDETPSNYLMINQELENKTWDWEIKLICNSTDKINFIIDYEDYDLNYTLKTLCEEIADKQRSAK